MLPLKLVSNFHKETRHQRKGNKLAFIGNLHVWVNIIKLRGAQCFISGRLRSNNGYVAAKTSFETKQLLSRRMEMSRCISAEIILQAANNDGNDTFKNDINISAVSSVFSANKFRAVTLACHTNCTPNARRVTIIRFCYLVATGQMKIYIRATTAISGLQHTWRNRKYNNIQFVLTFDGNPKMAVHDKIQLSTANCSLFSQVQNSERKLRLALEVKPPVVSQQYVVAQ